MRRTCQILILISLMLPNVGFSQQSSPSGTISNQPPRRTSDQKGAGAQIDQRGSEQSSLSAKTLLPVNSTQEAANEKTDREDKSSADWWMVRLTGLIALIGVGQGFVFYIQARRLRQTVVKMDEIAAGQTADMNKSIAESAKAALAMQSLAESMAANVEIVRDVANVNKFIADRQAALWPLQMRAYISVMVGNAIYQDTKMALQFEAKPVLVNTGNTPAHNVRYSIKADILPIPLVESRDFSVPPPFGRGNVVAPHANGTMSAVVDRIFFDEEVADIKQGKGRALVVWGRVEYEDVFRELHHTNFCQVLMWRANDSIVGYHQPHHSDAN
jgi:hypothetical protein